MQHCNTVFGLLLQKFDTLDLEKHRASAFGMWADLTLAYFNPAWVRFAEENGGRDVLARWSLESYVPEAISRPLRGYYQRWLKRCLDERRVWQHRYECSSPQEFRLMQMNVYPLAESHGLLVVNSCLAAHPHQPAERRPHAPDESLYLDQNGLLHQCSHCRRVQRLTPGDVWDWVPAWAQRSPAHTSHVTCPVCLDDYYRESDDVVDALARQGNEALAGV